MPWCGGCDRYWTPTSLHDDGTCPSCGASVDEAAVATRREAQAEEVAGDRKVPWHFWVMLVAVVGYLGWRLLEGVVWLLQQL